MLRSILVATDSDPVFTIEQFGNEDVSEKAHWGPGQRDYWIIHYVSRGKGYFNGHQVTDNQCFLIAPDVPHVYFSDTDDPWQYYWVVLRGTGVDRRIQDLRFDPETRIGTDTRHRQIIALFDFIFKNHEGTVPNEFGRACFDMLLSYHDQRQPGLDQLDGGIARKHVDKALAYIQINYCHPIRIQDVADFVHLDNQYLHNLFQKQRHESPKKYLNQVRIGKASEILLRTTLSVTEAANSVGYADPCQFSRFFKSQTGWSPQAFREKFRQT